MVGCQGDCLVFCIGEGFVEVYYVVWCRVQVEIIYCVCDIILVELCFKCLCVLVVIIIYFDEVVVDKVDIYCELWIVGWVGFIVVKLNGEGLIVGLKVCVQVIDQVFILCVCNIEIVIGKIFVGFVCVEGVELELVVGGFEKC